MKKKQSILASDGVVSLLSSIICILIGLVVGFVVLLLLGGEKA